MQKPRRCTRSELVNVGGKKALLTTRLIRKILSHIFQKCAISPYKLITR